MKQTRRDTQRGEFSRASAITFCSLLLPALACAPEGIGLVEDPGLSEQRIGTLPVRVVAANLTTGTDQSWDLGHGKRILQGLEPDVTLMQEFLMGNSSETELRGLVDDVCGSECHYCREEASLPNGVISRFPISGCGVWLDPLAPNREFVWSRIDIPGDRDLWAVSVHLLTKSASVRRAEAEVLVDAIAQHVPPDAYLVVGGDLNTGSPYESTFGVLEEFVSTDRRPADTDGNPHTNRTRVKPYDWVLPSYDLENLQVATQFAGRTLDHGMVFDSADSWSADDIAPILVDDSDAPFMQHMAVVKDFLLPE